jgi:hypothetical protein
MIFLCFSLSLIPFSQWEEVGSKNVYSSQEGALCWLNHDISQKVRTFLDVIIFYVYALLTLLLSLFCLVKSLVHLASRIDLPVETKSSIHRLLLYPVAMVCVWALAAFTELSNSSRLNYDVYYLPVSMSGILYSSAYWASNQRSRFAWKLFFLDLISPSKNNNGNKNFSTRLAMAIEGIDLDVSSRSNSSDQSVSDSNSPQMKGSVDFLASEFERGNTIASNASSQQDSSRHYGDTFIAEDLSFDMQRISKYMLRLTEGSVELGAVRDSRSESGSGPSVHSSNSNISNPKRSSGRSTLDAIVENDRESGTEHTTKSVLHTS